MLVAADAGRLVVRTGARTIGAWDTKPDGSVAVNGVDALIAELEPAVVPVARPAGALYARSMPAERTATRKRSLVKALTYRVVIVCLDFLVVYLFTHKVEVALGFMIVSNIYTTAGYFLHERIWARIGWGTEPTKAT